MLPVPQAGRYHLAEPARSRSSQVQRVYSVKARLRSHHNARQSIEDTTSEDPYRQRSEGAQPSRLYFTFRALEQRENRAIEREKSCSVGYGRTDHGLTGNYSGPEVLFGE